MTTNMKVIWLTDYVKQKYAEKIVKIPCAEIRGVLKQKFGDLTDRELGVLIRQCFPGVTRKRTGNVNYYENISLKVAKVDEEVQVEKTEMQISDQSVNSTRDEGTQADLTGGLYCVETTIPACMRIGREQLIQEDPPVTLGKGCYGEVSLQIYQGMQVAVKTFTRQSTKAEVLREILTIINIKAHKNLPIVYGTCLECKPFLMVSKFYGSASNKTSTTLHGYLRKLMNKSESQSSESGFVGTILVMAGDICEAIEHIHSCGYLHGDIKADNILVSKEKSKMVPKIIDFGKSCAITRPSHSCVSVKNEAEYKRKRLLYPHMARELLFGKPRSVYTDIFAYGILFNNMLKTVGVKETCFNILLEQVLSDRPEERSSLKCIANVIQNFNRGQA